MKKKLKTYTNELPLVIVSERLEKYDKLPIFQKKLDKANAILAKSPPFEALKAMENDWIKGHFEQGKTLADIAVLIRLSAVDIELRLQDMGLIEATI
jgi:hypothetical protein